MSETSPSEITRFRDFVAHRLGLFFDDDKLGVIASVMQQRLAAKPQSLATYLAHVSEAELGLLAEKLTTGETYFFRYAEHFAAFVETVVPSISHRPLRILSAGCASGEEPYSLAIEMDHHHPDVEVEIVAVDLNPAALARARVGHYGAWSLRETPSPLRARYFEEAKGRVTIAKRTLSRVRFEQCNLVDANASIWAEPKFDIVFCRNVVMYFERETISAVVDRIANLLSPGGYLFMGHAESLRGLSRRFDLVSSHDTFYYRLAGVPLPVQAESLDEVEHASVPIPHPTKRVSLEAKSEALETSATMRILALLDADRTADAMAIVRTLPERVRESADVQIVVAVLLANSGEYAECERVCRNLLAGGQRAGAHHLLSLCREHARDFDGAVEHDKNAVRLDATFAMPRLHLALMQRRGGDRDAARKSLECAIALFESETDVRIRLFAGGFGRESLLALCRRELDQCSDAP